MTQRDSQRSKVYTAEKAIWEKSERYETLPEINAFLATVLKDEWFKREFPWVYRVNVYDGRGRSRTACGNSDRWRQPWMKLPKFARTDAIILHELAHGLQPKGTPFHGREFCSIFTRLVFRFMGAEAFRDLTDSFRAHRVEYVWMAGRSCGLPPLKSLVQSSASM